MAESVVRYFLKFYRQEDGTVSEPSLYRLVIDPAGMREDAWASADEEWVDVFPNLGNRVVHGDTSFDEVMADEAKRWVPAAFA